MISKLKRKTALITVIMILFAILTGCAALTKPIDQTSAGNQELSPEQDVTLMPPEEDAAKKYLIYLIMTHKLKMRISYLKIRPLKKRLSFILIN